MVYLPPVPLTLNTHLVFQARVAVGEYFIWSRDTDWEGGRVQPCFSFQVWQNCQQCQ